METGPRPVKPSTGRPFGQPLTIQPVANPFETTVARSERINVVLGHHSRSVGNTGQMPTAESQQR